MIISQVLTSGNLDEMVAFYTHVFGRVEVFAQKDMGEQGEIQFRHLKMLGNEFFVMNGATPNGKVPNLFYIVVFPEDQRQELVELHKKLRDESRDLSHVLDMWSDEDLYLLQDKYGLLWHFWLDPDCQEPEILPCMVLSDDLVGKLDTLEEFYSNIFDSVEFGRPTYLDNGLIDHVSIKLLDHELQVCESSEKDLFSFDTISSLRRISDTQEEIDHYGNSLAAKFFPAGWLEDKMGLYWCVVWSRLTGHLVQANEVQTQNIFASMLGEGPICIEDIKRAYDEGEE